MRWPYVTSQGHCTRMRETNGTILRRCNVFKVITFGANPNTRFMKNATVQELIEHHLRASGPCTAGSILAYVAGQSDCRGYQITSILFSMVEDQSVLNDTDGIYEWNYGNRTDPLVKRFGFQGEPIFLKA